MVKDMGYSEVGRLYNVSDNAIRKWMKAYKVNHKTFEDL
jgi:transposase-like protein